MFVCRIVTHVAHESPAEETFASELSKVEMKDTSTMLADIDSEVTLMVCVCVRTSCFGSDCFICLLFISLCDRLKRFPRGKRR